MWTYTWDVVVVARAVGEQAVPDLPGEDGGTLAFVLGDSVDDAGRCHARLRTPDRSRLNRAGLVVPKIEYPNGLFLIVLRLTIRLCSLFKV